MDDEIEVRSIEEGLFADEAEESGGSQKGDQSDEDIDKKSGEDEKDKEKDEKSKRIKPKKIGPVKRIALHEDMLCGPNGLLKLEEVFKDFKLGGKGQEKEDLDRILHKLEHWVHNLYPRFNFGQTLERIEFLGMKKKVLKTHLKKIRMGMVSNTNFIDEDNLPDLGDSDVEMENHVENPGIHTESNGVPKSSGAQPTPMDDDDDGDDFDDEFMAMIDRVTKSAEAAATESQSKIAGGAAKASFSDEYPDPDDLIDQLEREISEDEELMDLHDKLRDSPERGNGPTFQDIGNKPSENLEEVTVLISQNDQTTLLVTEPVDSSNSDVEMGDKVNLEKTEICATVENLSSGEKQNGIPDHPDYDSPAPSSSPSPPLTHVRQVKDLKAKSRFVIESSEDDDD